MENRVEVATSERNSHAQHHDVRLIENRRVRSETLFAGGRELVIEHAGREYRLRITNKGKLILTA